MKSLYFIFFLLLLVVLLKSKNNLFASATQEDTQDRAFRIQQRACTDRDGNQGMCMFQWECRQRKGLMLTTCLDRFLFGTCCKLPNADQFNIVTGNGSTATTSAATNTGVSQGNPPLHGSSEGANTNFVITSDENEIFSSPPTPFAHQIKNLTTLTYSTPDIDKIFNQFLGSVLTNYSEPATVAVTRPTVFQEGGVSLTTSFPNSHTDVTESPSPNLVIQEDVTMSPSPSWSETPVKDKDNRPTMTSTPLQSSSTSSIVQYDDTTPGGESDYSDSDYESTANAVISDWSDSSSQQSTHDDPESIASTFPTSIEADNDFTTTTEDQQVTQQLGEVDWIEEVSPEEDEQLTTDDLENLDQNQISPLPEMLQASEIESTETTTPLTTTTTTTTTTEMTTTIRHFDYKKGSQNKSLFSSRTMWFTTFLTQFFANIPTITLNALGIRRNPECLASACGLHHSPSVDSRISAIPNEAYCGVRPLVPSGRIVGGTSSRFGEWPWQVLVKEATWLGLFVKNKCGGVLLNTRYVITAAHCQPSFLASLLVVFGENDLSVGNKELKPLQRNVRRVIPHRKFNALTFDNDLALLEMDRPIEYKPHIVPICLPPDGFDVKDKIGTVTGWGRLKYGGRLPNQLQQVDVPIIPNRKCQQMFLSAGHIKSIGDKFLCAGFQEGVKDSCEGDSGGPLVMEDDDGRWMLVGTVSHGIKCAYPNLPGIYINISAYKSWIQRIING